MRLRWAYWLCRRRRWPGEASIPSPPFTTPPSRISRADRNAGFGHITIAYIASNFVQPQTQHYFQSLLRNDTGDYLANVATWADSIRYTKWGHYTGVYHFIDAKDSPPTSCSVDLDRDCKAEGCVVTAIQNYTTQVLDPSMPAWLRAQAAKFVVHFVSDIHQPLHDEDVERGGNGIHVLWNGAELNLHHVWDSSIAERLVGGGVPRKPFHEAKNWADRVTAEIRGGRFEEESGAWLDGVDFADPIGTALSWARQGNAYVCSHGEMIQLLLPRPCYSLLCPPSHTHTHTQIWACVCFEYVLLTQ